MRLKTEGESEQSIAAYRCAIEMRPCLGEAYWSLANLKTFRFTPRTSRSMRGALARPDLTSQDRLHFEFSLGKALEDEQVYEESFAIMRRAMPCTGSCILTVRGRISALSASRHRFTRRFFSRDGPVRVRRRAIRFSSSACRAQAPPCSSRFSRATRRSRAPLSCPICRKSQASSWDETRTGRPFFAAVEALGARTIRALADGYLASTRVHRKYRRAALYRQDAEQLPLCRLIHLLLPNANIIDARRHPVGCCFSAFKQHFARGQNFTYDLADLGRYYRDYVELMAHFDAVLPGRVHRVFYESVIEDTEGEVRRLLDFCGLPFEERCLKFYENDRPVRTASSEQVRRPIFATAWTSGDTTSDGSDRCSRRSARY